MLAVRDIRKADGVKDARDAAADREGMSRAFHAAVLDVGEVDYTSMFSRETSTNATPIVACGAGHGDVLCAVIFMMRQWLRGIPCAFRMASSALGGVDYTSMFHVKHRRNWRAE